MGEEKENVCRLCLKCEGDTFSPLDESSKEQLKLIVPELDLDATTDVIVCSKCKESFEESCELKKTCSNTDQFIRIQAENENVKDKKNLNHIVNASGEAEGDTNSESAENICRICLKNKEVNYMSINAAKTDDLFTTALETCLQELDVELTSDPVICEGCHNTLRNMYSFKTGCLSVEEKLKRYRESTSESEIDLTNVVNFLKTESKKSLGEDNFLSEFEVQDEEEADIFDIFPSFSGDGGTTNEKDEASKKRPLTEGSSVVPAKKPKKDPNDVLPYFNFNFNLIYNPKTEGTVEEWLMKVDELKTKSNWTDYVTIHKVLEKLRPMEDLYTWFSNISEIMTWDEWKQKLIQMFPRQNDFYIKLKRMFNRKKRPTETYLEYYESKLKLIREAGIAEDKVVSCLIGGLSDIAVGCIARVGNYKTPEALSEYFKSINDKKPTVIPPTKKEPKDTDAAKDSSQSSADKRKKTRVKCYTCRKYGHTSKECWAPRPVTNGAVAKPKPPTPGVVKPKKKCIHCGKIAHPSQYCPRKRSAGAPAPKPQSQQARAARLSSPRGRFTGALEKKPARPQQTPKKDKANAATSRCHSCGKFGHLQRNCRSKSKQAPPAGGFSDRAAANDRYFNREAMLGRMQDDTSRIVCFKCFRVGHDARDCVEYGGRAFRN